MASKLAIKFGAVVRFGKVDVFTSTRFPDYIGKRYLYSDGLYDEAYFVIVKGSKRRIKQFTKRSKSGMAVFI